MFQGAPGTQMRTIAHPWKRFEKASNIKKHTRLWGVLQIVYKKTLVAAIIVSMMNTIIAPPQPGYCVDAGLR